MFDTTTTKAGSHALKTAYKKLVHKAAETTGEFIGKKIAEKFMKPKPVFDANSRNAEELVIPTDIRQ